MIDSKVNAEDESSKPREGIEDSEEDEDEDDNLEESPCGRWLKRREEVRLMSWAPDYSLYTVCFNKTG